MSNEPKPCPFCGNPEINPEGWRDNSGRFGPQCFDCWLLQLDAWNHRPVEEELRAKLEKAETAIDNYISDFWVGCIDPDSNFALSCKHDGCKQCRMIALKEYRSTPCT